jgi:hypothetical protein
MKDTTPRKTAKALGLKRYEGRACLYGHGTTRYVASGDCTRCRDITKLIAAQQKRILRGPVKLGRKRKHPIFVGPLKPKRVTFKPETEIDHWIVRSKGGKKARLRKGLSIADYKKLIVTHCPLLGIELSYEKYPGKAAPYNYASLDKIDPSKGYVVGNVQILSFRANTLKNSATLDELKLIVKNWPA